MRFLYRLALGLMALTLILQPWASCPVAAQEASWNRPVNLSLSGAASAPQLVQGEGGVLYAYWWDQFDGLTLSSLGPEGWETPQPVPISDISYDADGQPNVNQETGVITRVTVRSPGTVAGDNAGRVNAFFLGTTAAAQRPLRQASATLGSGSWSEARTIAPGASAWRSVTGPDGVIHLAIMYPGRAGATQPGLYYMRSEDGGATWSEWSLVAESLYVRMASQTDTHLQLTPGEDGRLFVAWNEPGTGRALYSWSWDGGESWSRPHLVDPGDRTATRPQIALGAGDNVLMVWQGTTTAGEKTLMTKRSEDGGWNWTAPERAFASLGGAAAQVTLQSLPDGNVLLAAGGQADGPLLAVWQPGTAEGPAQAGWSSLMRLGYPVRDLDAQVATEVGTWQATVHGDGELALVGSDQNGDVWLLGAHLAELAWTYPETASWVTPAGSEEAGWDDPVQLAESGVVAVPLVDALPPAAEAPAPEAPAVAPAPEEVRHVVAEGDNLAVLAERYGVSVDEIAAANGITETNVLLVGRDLIIPGAAPEPAAEAEPTAPPVAESAPALPSLAGAGPQIVAGPDGQLQAFWWHAFDGLTSAWFDGVTWLQPQRASAYVLPSQQSWLPPLGAVFVSDGVGKVHAFWSEGDPAELRHSSLTMGAHAWAEPNDVAVATAWRAAADDQGAMYVLYEHPAQGDSPAGLEIRWIAPGEATWSEPVSLREFAAGVGPAGANAHPALAAAGGAVYAAWDDAESRELLWAHSEDGGQSWSVPASLASPELGARSPLLAAFPDGALLLFEATAGSGAGALQQVRIDAAGQVAGPPTSVLPEIAVPLSGGERLTLQTSDGQAALLLAGIGGDTLTVALWRGDGASQGGWSAPQTLGFGPQGPVGGRSGDWGRLQGVLAADRFTALALGTEGDLWAISREAAGDDWAQVAAPVWSDVELIGSVQPHDREITVSSDAQGRVHVLWSVSQQEGEAGRALWYTRYADGRWTQPGAVITPQEGGAEHPSLALVGQRLHAVWSGGTGGRIQYAAAFAADAYAASSWPQPIWLPAPLTDRSAVAAHPQIRADLAGGLHVLYAVPINQERGIYYTHSGDGGATWSPVVPAFNAEEAGWAMVDQPTLAVGYDGTLYAAWLRLALTGGAPRAEALYMARSTDGGVSWSAPKLVAEGHLLAPELLVAGPGEVHLLWQEAGAAYGVWHSHTVDGGEEWSLPMRVRGFSRLAGTADAVSDGMGLVYLVGPQLDAEGHPELIQALWDSESEQWRLENAHLLPRAVLSADGAWLALEPLNGNLEVVLHGQVQEDDAEQASTALLHMRRQVAPREALPSPAPELIATPTPQPTPTAQPTPTVRPTVNIEAPPEPSAALDVGILTVPLLSLGGVVVVALLVLGVLVARSARRR